MADPAPDPNQLDMLTSPEQAAGLTVGTIRGPAHWFEGFGAGLDVYVGEGQWRSMGELLNPDAAGIIMHKGRLSAGLSWDLGPVKLNWAKKP